MKPSAGAMELATKLYCRLTGIPADGSAQQRKEIAPYALLIDEAVKGLREEYRDLQEAAQQAHDSDQITAALCATLSFKTEVARWQPKPEAEK